MSKQLYERTGILRMRLGSKCACLLSVQSNWLKMNQVAFHLGEPIFWYIALQQQIEAPLETSHLQIEDADISATDRIHHLFEEAISRRGSDFHLEPEKIQLRVQFRIDGYLQDSVLMPISFQPLIFSRIK